MEEGSSSLTPKQKDHISIQVVHDEDLATSIKSKMENMSQSYSICRVPEQLQRESKDRHIYCPSLISIGPLHHGKFENGDQHKWRYFNTLLTRKPNTEAVLDRCINALRRHEAKARKFYCKMIEIGSNQFVEMLLIDACFVIELFLEHEHEGLRRRDDPLLDKMSQLTCDLILLENQLPFFVLEHLFHLVPIPNQCSKSLTELALRFFRELIPGSICRHKFCPEIHHLLDLVRLHYLPTHPSVETVSTTVPRHKPVLQHATHLHTLGIKLVRACNSNSPLDITFVNGELRIPPLQIHDHTEILLGTLIAMEHCHPECPKVVTSYAYLMEQLVKFKNDVMLLQDRGILDGGYNREAYVVIMFKRLQVDISVKEFYYEGVCEAVVGYKASTGRKHWESLRHVYHRTRLGIAGFSLALLVLVFLFTGVLFSVLTYLLHHFQ